MTAKWFVADKHSGFYHDEGEETKGDCGNCIVLKNVRSIHVPATDKDSPGLGDVAHAYEEFPNGKSTSHAEWSLCVTYNRMHWSASIEAPTDRAKCPACEAKLGA